MFIRKNNAFTLVEMLVVLAISSFIFLFSFATMQRLYAQTQADLFGKLLAKQIQLVQQVAQMSQSQQDLLVSFSNRQVRYLNKVMPIPSVIQTGTDAVYTFAAHTGSLTRYQNITFETATDVYTLHVQFGRGVSWLVKNKKS